MSTQFVAEPEVKSQTNPSQAYAAAGDAPVLTLPEQVQQRPMFSQSFVVLSAEERKRKRTTQLFSFSVQSVIVVFLILLPLWFTDVLPVQQLATFLVAPPPPPPPPPPAAPTVKVERISEVVNGQLLTPSKIPQKVKMIKEEEAPPPVNGVIGGVEGGVPGGQVSGVLGSLISRDNQGTSNIAPPPVKHIVKISTGISEGMLQRRVEPIYPMIAQRARIQGTVQLRAIISKQGTIENLQLISGHALLVQSAMDAVQQWRYRPYVLNGEPLEVETVVIVNFHIN